jgi:ubiquinone/menaquinone biosynthesis C-methylase UbiE
MADFQFIYQHQAAQYDRLVSREDYQHNILRALTQIRSMRDADIVELGADTGRLTLLLAPIARSIVLNDASKLMLDVAQAKLKQQPKRNWKIVVSDHRALPLPDRCAEVSIAAWTISMLSGRIYPDTARHEIDRAVQQMCRVLRPRGTMIILETLGTGSETPHPPNEALANYYSMLENDYGFASMWIRTDLEFESVAEADELTRFFFGDELADRIQRDQLTILPECTGLWWRAG